MDNRLSSNEWLQPEKLYLLQDSAEFLSQDERGSLYNLYYKTADLKLAGLLLNICLPGLGNLVIRDYPGTVLNCIGTYGFGTIFGLTAAFAKPSVGGYILLLGSGAGFVLSYLYNLVSPFTFIDDYNYRLALAMKMDQDLGMQYRPKMGPVLPVIFNLVPGFGIGSFAQGDTVGGLIGLGLDVCAGLCLAVGVINYSSEANYMDYANPDPSFTLPRLQLYTGLIIAGGVIAGLNRIFGIIKPIWYSADYNKKLVSAGMSVNSFAVKPYVVPSLVNDKLDMQFGLNLELGI